MYVNEIQKEAWNTTKMLNTTSSIGCNFVPPWASVTRQRCSLDGMECNDHTLIKNTNILEKLGNEVSYRSLLHCLLSVGAYIRQNPLGLVYQHDFHLRTDKQRVLMHGHQGWNVRHGLCHIYMIYVYIYIWVAYSFCLFCCLFIIVTTQFVALYKPCKPKPKPSTYDTPPDNHPLAEIHRDT